MNNKFNEQTEEFFLNLSKSPVYQGFLSVKREDDSRTEKFVSYLEKRVHSFAYYLVSEIIEDKIREPSTDLQELLQRVMISSISDIKRKNIMEVTQSVEKYAQKYIPEFLEHCDD